MTCTQPVLAASRYTGASPTVSGKYRRAGVAYRLLRFAHQSVERICACRMFSKSTLRADVFFCVIGGECLCGPATKPPPKNRAENILGTRVYNQYLSVQRSVCCLVGNSNFAQKYRTLTYKRDIIAARRITAMHQLCQPVCACTYSSRVCTYIKSRPHRPISDMRNFRPQFFIGNCGKKELGAVDVFFS